MGLRGWIRRRRAERGAGLVELAMIVPFIILLTMGVLEFGLAWRASLSVSNSLRSATRATSNAGEDRLADYNGLTALESGMAGIGDATVTKVVIYEAPASGNVPASCLTATAQTNRGVDGLCNVYTGADMANAVASNFPGTTTCTTGSWDLRWCPPSQRESSPAAAGGADYVGIYVEVDLDFQTGLFGDGMTITDETIMRLEPKAI